MDPPLPEWVVKQLEKLMAHGFGELRIQVRGGEIVKVLVEPLFAFTEKGYRRFSGK